jgi:hypothetical protein
MAILQLGAESARHAPDRSADTLLTARRTGEAILQRRLDPRKVDISYAFNAWARAQHNCGSSLLQPH